jgi:hypothetical protein
MGPTGRPVALAFCILFVERRVKSPRKWARKRLAMSQIARPVINRIPSDEIRGQGEEQFEY